MLKLPSSLQKLINELSKLPGIGPKTAQRLAFYLLKKDAIDIAGLSGAIANIKHGLTFCSVCHNMAETDPCSVCGDNKRDHSIICVVEEPLDALAIDKSGEFKGVFHVLGGVLNPLEGIGPEKLEVESLVQRISLSANQPVSGAADQQISLSANQFIRGSASQPVTEVIIATNPSLEGETTAMHLQKLLRKHFAQLKITRIARGLPMGGDLEYADDITLMRAMEGRREY